MLQFLRDLPGLNIPADEQRIIEQQIEALTAKGRIVMSMLMEETYKRVKAQQKLKEMTEMMGERGQLSNKQKEIDELQKQLQKSEVKASEASERARKEELRALKAETAQKVAQANRDADKRGKCSAKSL